MTLIETKLQNLRDEYKTASRERRKQIEVVAKRIKKSAHLYKPVILSMKEFRKPKSGDRLKEDVRDALL